MRLRPQPAALLQYLLKHPGEVVTREDLRKVLWPEGTFVCFDHGLNSCIKQLRAALSDQRRAPRYLETLPRRGYRLISAVDVESTIGRGTPADFLLDCSVQIAGGRLHVTVELKDSTDKTYTWTADTRVDLSSATGRGPCMVSTILETVALWFRQDAGAEGSHHRGTEFTERALFRRVPVTR